MQKLIIILTVLLLGLMTRSNGQMNYDSEMQSALKEYYVADSTGQYDVAAAHFDRIAKEYPDNWLPLYYSILVKSIEAFQLDTEKAIKVAGLMEKEYDRLIELNPDRSEALTLRGLFRTVKLAKDPMTYGMVLPSSVIADYNEAIKENPGNPRPLYLLGQFNMRSAPYYGNDPAQYCPMITRAKQLYVTQKKNGFEPVWGEDEVDEILSTDCAE